MTSLAILVSLLAAVPAPVPATGRVVRADGTPIPRAEVCVFRDIKPKQCVEADDQGFYRMEAPVGLNLLVQAKGFLAKVVSSAPQETAVVLEHAAGLRVRIVDAATGEAISAGTVTLFLPSGKRVGSPVPFNRAGVKMSTLTPGDTMVRAEADGYTPGGPLVVKLVAAQEKELVIKMTKAPAR